MAQQYGPKIVTDGLVLSLDAADKNSYIGSGTTWTDLSGNGNDGTLSSAGMGTVSGSNVIAFDGDDDYVTIGDSTTMGVGTSNFTMITWVNFNSLSGNQSMLEDEGADANDFVRFEFFDESDVNRIDIRGHTNSPNQYNFIITTGDDAVTATNTWYHIAGVVTRNSTANSKIYINAVDRTGSNTNNESSTINSHDFSNYVLGRRATVGDFDLNGQQAGVHMYMRALSAKEISQNFNAQRSRFGV